MPATDAEYLKGLYQALTDRPLEPDEAWYEELYANPKLAAADPVEEMAASIEWAPQSSARLFSGFRGTGKSTEMRRLRARLESTGTYKVVLCDMADYVNLSTRLDVSDFLLAVAGALGDALTDTALLGADPAHRSYWERFVDFLVHTDVKMEGVDVKAGTESAGASLKLNLKNDPAFKERLQVRMKGHLAALKDDVHDYVAGCVAALRNRLGADWRFVLILDSVERIRGGSMDHEEVSASVENVFLGHRDKLRLPELHVIYTVPPWLKVRAAGLGGLYDGSHVIPCVKVRDAEGSPFQPGLDTLADLIHRRADWTALLGTREAFDRVALASGGYLRDLFRLFRVAAVQARAQSLPLSPDRVLLAMQEVRKDYVPLSNTDAVWLDRVAKTHRAEMEGNDQLGELARFFDTHLVLCYRNGDEWYDVHPLIRDAVAAQAEDVRARRAAEKAETGGGTPG